MALLKLLFEFPQSAELSLEEIGTPEFVLVVTIMRRLHNGHSKKKNQKGISIQLGTIE